MVQTQCYVTSIKVSRLKIHKTTETLSSMTSLQHGVIISLSRERERERLTTIIIYPGHAWVNTAQQLLSYRLCIRILH